MTKENKHIPSPKNEVFFQIWHGFSANIGSLWLFSQEISKVADRLDRKKVKEIAHEMAGAFGDNPREVEEDLLSFFPSLDDADIYPNFYENPNLRETFQFFKTGEFKERVLEWAIKNVGKSQRFAYVFTNYLAEPPASGVILRRNTLLTLITSLEVLFENLLFVHYHYREELSVEKAHKKADIRGWEKRIKKLKNLGVQFGATEFYLDELYEIQARRNRIIHGDGIVNERYLKNAPQKYQPENVKKGQMLIVSTRYLTRAFHIITLIAFQASQSAWREWRPKRNRKKANNALINFIFSVLKQERYELVKDLASLCYETKLTKRTEQFILVNHAVALRELGESEEMGKIILKLGAQKRVWEIRIAYAVLRKNYDKAHLLLLSAAERNELIHISMYWPLFYPVRDKAWFQKIFDSADRGKLPQARTKRFSTN